MPESLKTVKSGRFGNQSAIFHFHLGIFRAVFLTHPLNVIFKDMHHPPPPPPPNTHTHAQGCFSLNCWF